MKYGFGAYTVDTERLELSEEGTAISLQPQAFSLLVFLIENAERVVSKDEIIDSVWQGRIVGDGTLNARINALRRALGDDGVTQSMIKTFPRKGFRFVGKLSNVVAVSSPESKNIAPQGSIAVLPFVNISADQEQLYFADGLTEDLITDLSKNRDLFVIARNSSFAYRNSPKNVTEIGSELGVDHVLEGSVRKAGNRIRINAQLIDTATGGHVWAERYDSDVEDIFALQDEITAKIATALQVNLVRAQIARPTHSVEAYELCLKGRAKFFMFSPETNRECINLFEQAVAIDPNYSDAWAGQVFPFQSGWSFAWPGYDKGLDIAAEKARRAVELAPNSSLAQSRLGWVQTFLRQPEASINSFERAIVIDPNNADTYIWFSEALNYAGQPERAVEAGETALRFDPVAPPNALHHIAHGYFLSGDLEKAEQYERRAIRMAPSFPPARLVMSAIMVAAGRPGEAKEQMADMLAIDSKYSFQRYHERYPYHDPEHRDRMAAAVKAAGLT
ncbi:MAG: winged helix-turn-helix domain-containing tetratricopeptide repeat protein [Paracoccaceae bacterium]